MPLSPRPAVRHLCLPAHGGIDYVELDSLNLKPEETIDFSANLSPYGIPPGATEAVARCVADGHLLARYPDRDVLELRRRLAAHLSASAVGIDEHHIVAGNGSSELLWLVALAYLDPADRVAIVGPTFGEYERAARLMGADVREFRACAEQDFQVDVPELLRWIADVRPRLIFLCNPNNPTGKYLSVETVASLCADDRLVVLDEAYEGFVEHPSSFWHLLSHGVIVLRSMTKDFCLAGLRLGYAVATPETISALRKVAPPWNVNALAQVAGLACLPAPEDFADHRRELREAAAYLTACLSQLGLRVVPSDTTFFLVEVGNAYRFRKRLLAQRILVRDCTSFGLPTFVRVAARSMSECQRLIEAVERVQEIP